MTRSLIKGPNLNPHQGPIKHLVIFLHGYGASGDDLISLGDEWRHALPQTLFLSPNAPFPCEMSPLGRQWFSLENWNRETLVAGAKAAAPYVRAFVDHHTKQHHLHPKNVILVGFSQGAMMALHTALKGPEPLGGVVAYSGSCLWSEADIPQPGTPLLLVHGSKDDVVPLESFHDAKRRLSAMGLAYDAHEIKNLGHSIDHRGLELGLDFCQHHLL